MADLIWIGLRGLVIGLAIAAPVGPIGVLCIRRTLSQGRLAGFLSGLGAATADAFLGSLAVFGINVIADLMISMENWLRIVGGLFLVFLGVQTFFSRPAGKSTPDRPAGKAMLYFSTLALTLTNPLTILSFAAIMASLGFDSSEKYYVKSGVFIAGVFSGSAAWWLFLSVTVGLFKGWLNTGRLVWVNRLSGMVIAAFGIAALFQAGYTPQRGISSTLVVASTPQAAALVPQGGSEGFAHASPGRMLEFPIDQGPHPDFQTEWWYYTGNLAASDGRRFGYQLTFFRRALLPPAERADRPSAWAAQQMYLAHLALTDVSAGQHYTFERLERGAAGIAGAQAEPFEVWLDDWQVVQDGAGRYRLEAAVQHAQAGWLRLDLALQDVKGPVLQGDSGYSQKGPDPGDASYYYSLTRLESSGSISVGEQQYQVAGLSWMDHEFSTSALSQNQVGWDWFSIQMDDGSELMVFQIRQKDGSIDPFSSGAYINPDGSIVRLRKDDFQIEVLDTWKSEKSGGLYPARWKVSVPAVSLQLDITPLVADQEMALTYTYWEGAVRLQGSRAGNALTGFGYVELTGYAGSMAGEF